MDATYVGIDVSKQRLDVHVADTAETSAVPRNDTGLAELSRRLADRPGCVVVLEATGGFENVVTAHLAAAGIAVVRVNPAQVRAFARALGQRAKTDAIDAAVIARCGGRVSLCMTVQPRHPGVPAYRCPFWRTTQVRPTVRSCIAS